MKRVLGYSVPWSAAPAETVALHVGLLAGSDYELDVVRVISGDAQGLGLDLRPVPHPLAGRYPGRRPHTQLGSALIVATAPVLDPAAAFEVSLAAWPTLIADGRQALIGHWSEPDESGWLLELDGAGRVAFRVGAASVVSHHPLPERRWTRIEACCDPVAGVLTLALTADRDGLTAERRDTVRAAVGALATAAPPRPLVVAALAESADARRRGYHFNGKLARPAVRQHGRLVAAWDFAPGAARIVADRAGGVPGELVNLPARAVTGPDWRGDIHDWRADPCNYDAIHFHADDLYDAAWPVSHALTIPDDWPSAYYAVRLRAGDDTSYLPLFVGPPRGTATAALAILVSSCTTLAYANYHFHLHVAMNEASLGRVGVLSREDVYLCETAEVGLSTYDLHRDGSPVRHASRLRPVLNNWPGGEVWNLNADTHLLAWLDRLGEPCDVITDEDLHVEGAALLGRYRALIAGSHPEYWTTPMWDGLETWLGAGGRLLYLGGNGFYWRTALSPDWPGAVEVRRAEGGARYTAETPGDYHLAFTGELGGLWRRSGRPPNALVGVGTRGIGFDGIGRFRRTAAGHDPRAAWLFDGVDDETFGSEGLIGCAAGSEIDATDPALGTPAHALVVAASEGHTDAMQPVPEDILMPHPAMSALYDARVRAELTFFETPGGGAVLAAGALTWPAAIAFAGFDNAVARLTGNALRRFLDPEPFALPDT